MRPSNPRRSSCWYPRRCAPSSSSLAISSATRMGCCCCIEQQYACNEVKAQCNISSEWALCLEP
eukprot:47404-Eustigmatos_ZCMA.PRE.1